MCDEANKETPIRIAVIGRQGMIRHIDLTPPEEEPPPQDDGGPRGAIVYPFHHNSEHFSSIWKPRKVRLLKRQDMEEDE